MKKNMDAGSVHTRQRRSWPIAEYALLERRIDLIDRYNRAVGAPSPAVARVHSDFIKDRMEASELIAFVVVCERLIAAAGRRDADKSGRPAPVVEERPRPDLAIQHS